MIPLPCPCMHAHSTRPWDNVSVYRERIVSNTISQCNNIYHKTRYHYVMFPMGSQISIHSSYMVQPFFVLSSSPYHIERNICHIKIRCAEKANLIFDLYVLFFPCVSLEFISKLTSQPVRDKKKLKHWNFTWFPIIVHNVEVKIVGMYICWQYRDESVNITQNHCALTATVNTSW